MLAGFPFPYPDESIYSVLARYQSKSGNVAVKKDYRDLFNENRIFIATDLPTGLEPLFNRINHYDGNISEHIIANHTPLIYFTNFLSVETRELIKHQMLKFESANKIHLLTGQVASPIKEEKYFRFCRECLNEDLSSYDETYWRVTNQLPGVYYCVIHRTMLSYSSVEYRQRYTNLVHANNENCQLNAKENSQLMELNSNEKKLLLLIAEESVYLNSNSINLSLEELQKYYHQLLIKYGYTSINGRIKQRKLVKEFTDFYGMKLLNILYSLPNESKQTNWLNYIARKHRKSFHPLRHILLNIFLNQTFVSARLISTSTKTTFYPCRNPIVKHYMEECALLKRSKKDKKGRTIGTIICNCGYEYIIHIDSYDPENNVGIGRVVNFGREWEKKLLELIEDEKVSFRKAANILKADVNTVINKYKKLKSPSIPREKELIIEKEKTEWLEAQKRYPLASKTELRALYPDIYMRLYRYSKEWLTMNSPKKIKTINKSRIDWHQRDVTILKEVKDFILSLRKTSNHQRITMKFIGLGIKKLSMIEKNLDKLPKTKLFVLSICESHYEYKVRNSLFNKKSNDLA